MTHISDVVWHLSEGELKAIHRRSLEQQLFARQREMITVSREIVRLQNLLSQAA
jgi:hypothetical protein